MDAIQARLVFEALASGKVVMSEHEDQLVAWVKETATGNAARALRSFNEHPPQTPQE